MRLERQQPGLIPDLAATVATPVRRVGDRLARRRHLVRSTDGAHGLRGRSATISERHTIHRDLADAVGRLPVTRAVGPQADCTGERRPLTAPRLSRAMARRSPDRRVEYSPTPLPSAPSSAHCDHRRDAACSRRAAALREAPRSPRIRTRSRVLGELPSRVPPEERPW